MAAAGSTGANIIKSTIAGTSMDELNEDFTKNILLTSMAHTDDARRSLDGLGMPELQGSGDGEGTGWGGGLDAGDLHLHVAAIQTASRITAVEAMDAGDEDAFDTVAPTPFPTAVVALPPPPPASAMPTIKSYNSPSGSRVNAETFGFLDTHTTSGSFGGAGGDDKAKDTERLSTLHAQIRSGKKLVAIMTEKLVVGREVDVDKLKKMADSVEALEAAARVIEMAPDTVKAMASKLAERCKQGHAFAQSVKQTLNKQFASLCFSNAEVVKPVDELLLATRKCDSAEFKKHMDFVLGLVGSGDASATLLADELGHSVAEIQKFRDAVPPALRSCEEHAALAMPASPTEAPTFALTIPPTAAASASPTAAPAAAPGVGK
jgi:hypothetical protein